MKNYAGSIVMTALLPLVACSTDTTRETAQPNNNNNNMNNVSPDAGVPMEPDAGPPPPQGLAILGNGTHSLGEVELTVVADAADDLNLPTDLEFHPERKNELWVVNEGSSQFWVGTDLGTDLKSVNSIRGRGAHLHFLTKPSGLAFGDRYCGNELCLATSHGNVNDRPQTTGNAPVDFMGPSLWTSDVMTYRGSGPYHAAHYDMLHNSPNAMGIAWDSGNAFWLFDGYHRAIAHYDFNDDHGAGGSDHSDGEINRWAQGSVAMVDGVPSHLEFDSESGLLYIADTGNKRVAVMDTNSGVQGSSYRNYDTNRPSYRYDAMITTLVDGGMIGIQQPSGLALYEGHLYVSDHATGTIYGFKLDGELVDYIDTQRGSGTIAGLAFDSTGNLYFADKANEQIVKISVKP